MFSESGLCTLVLAASSREGVVVCADKRRTVVSTQKTIDDAQKLLPAGENGLFWATGDGAEAIDLQSGRTVWSVFDEAKMYLDQNKSGTEPNLLMPFFDFIIGSYKNFLRLALLQKFDPSNERPQTQMIFCYRKPDGKFYIYRSVLWKRPSVESFIEQDGEYSEQFETSKVHDFGEHGIINELLHGHNSSFDRFRRNSMLMQIVIGSGRPDSLSYLTVQRALSNLIREMSESVGVIEGAEGVSQRCDCFLLPHSGTAKLLRLNLGTTLSSDPISGRKSNLPN